MTWLGVAGGAAGHLTVVRFTLFFKIVVGIVLVLAVLWIVGVGGFLGGR